MNFKAALLIGLLALSSTAAADYPHNMNTGLLMADCELLDRPSQVRCEAFLMGVADTVNALTFLKKLRQNYFCIPEGVNEIELRRAIVAYVAAESVKSTDPAVEVVMGAFGRAYPCK